MSGETPKSRISDKGAQASRLPLGWMQAGTPALLWSCGLIFAATLLAYGPAIRGGFIWDDDAHVTRPELQSLHGLKRIWLEVGATQQYYPVLHSAFWVEHRLWGDAPVGYHLVNILLHATAACLFGLVLTKIRNSKFEIRNLLAALIFALHPVCVESVAWISEQKNTLSTVFYLLAALVYLNFDGIRQIPLATKSTESTKNTNPSSNGFSLCSLCSLWPKGWDWYFIALALFILAVLSKSVTATLPAALLVVLYWQRGRLSWKRDVAPLVPFFAIGIAAGLFTAWVERRYIGARGAAFDLSAWDRCLLAGRVVWFYLEKLFWPANLMFVYPRWVVSAGVWWQYLFPLGVVAGLAVLWSIRRRTRGPLAGALFFVGSLFPALGFFNVYPFVFSYVADHFQYLAMLGIVAAAAAAIFRISNSEIRNLVAFATLGILGTLTWRQCRSYRDIETLYRTTLEQNPEAWMAHYNLGIVLARDGRLPEAMAEYERAIALHPGMADIHSDFGTALIRSGRVAEAIDQFEEAARLDPSSALAHLNLSAALKQAGRVEEAIAEGEETLRLQPEFPEASYNLGLIFQATGRLPVAIAQFERALAQRPGFREARLQLAAAHNGLGAALAGQGRLSEAVAQFQAALQVAPDDVEAHDNLGLALAQQNLLPEAQAQFEQALRLNPDDREAREALLQIQAATQK